MKRLVIAATFIISGAVSVAACANGGQDDEGVILRRDPPGRVPGSLGQGPALKTGDLSGDEHAAVDLAVSALQQRTDLSSEEIALGGIRPVEWSDSSLGCPQPGMNYLQVITPGYLVLLDADGKRHSVHVGRGRAVVCQRAVRSAPSGSRAGDIQRLEGLAKADLSSKLNVPADTIKRRFLNPATWPDTSLGCEGRGGAFETVKTTGLVFGLDAGGRIYTYHTDLDRIFACPEIATD